MKYKILILSLMLGNLSAITPEGEFTAEEEKILTAEERKIVRDNMYRNALNVSGKNAKICLKLLKQKIELTSEEKLDVLIAIKAYLLTLSKFHVYMAAKTHPEERANKEKFSAKSV